MKILGVVPARYASSRMPGKPIAEICGKPMIWWVYSKCNNSKRFDDVLIATDDDRIYSVCKEYGMKVMMTSESHDTPTSRLYEVSQNVDADLYYLVMGDEPLVDEKAFDLIIPTINTCEYYVAALTNRLSDPAEVIDFSNQKVVTDRNRDALLISRRPIPYPKGTLDIEYEKVTGIQVFSKKSLDFSTVLKNHSLKWQKRTI